eukprot:COSAG05_NODE_14188_length_405_cov_0.676471_1_plen_60_part_01
MRRVQGRTPSAISPLRAPTANAARVMAMKVCLRRGAVNRKVHMSTKYTGHHASACVSLTT